MIVEGSHREDGLQDACRAHRMPIVTFIPIDRHRRESGTLYGYGLHLVVEHRSGAVGIDEGQL